jgi:hypothetical protein
MIPPLQIEPRINKLLVEARTQRWHAISEGVQELFESVA